MTTEELIGRLRENGEHETYPPASMEAVEQTEVALGVKLPRSFRTFVTEYSNGAYLFSLQEVSAVGDGNPQVAPIQANLGGGFPAEAGVELPVAGSSPVMSDSVVPFSLDSNGNCWCFLSDRRSGDNEYEVAYCDTQQARLVGRLPSFDAWLELLIRDQDEVIRVLGFADQLGLG